MTSRPNVEALELVGGAPCLDLANTLDPRHGFPRVEYLGTYDDLVRWSVHAGLLAAGEGERLRVDAAADPMQGRAVVRRAVALREAAFTLFAATGDGPDEALTVLNTELRRSLASAQVEAAADGYRLGWVAGHQLDRMLWPVARDAADLLVSPGRLRVRQCAGADCGWLFVDQSKAGRRRWCSMNSCGNRAKATRFRRAHRAEPQ